MLRPTVVSLLLPFFLAGSHLLRSVRADPCIAMDTGFNLLVFGVNGKDWNAGTQDSWTSGECPASECEYEGCRTDVYFVRYVGSATDITAANRPYVFYILNFWVLEC